MTPMGSFKKRSQNLQSMNTSQMGEKNSPMLPAVGQTYFGTSQSPRKKKERDS